MNFRKKNPQLSNFVKIGPVGFSWHIFEKILKYQISWKSAQWDFLERFSKKSSNIKFREKRPSGIFSRGFRKNLQISNFVKTGPVGFSRQIFEKESSNIKFHENRSSGSRVVPCADVTKLIVPLCNFAKASSKFWNVSDRHWRHFKF